MGLTWDGLQFETICTEKSQLKIDELVLLVPLVTNGEDVQARLQVIEDMEGMLGNKAFRYSPKSFMDNDAWLNCASFVSVLLDKGHISTPSELATELLK